MTREEEIINEVMQESADFHDSIRHERNKNQQDLNYFFVKKISQLIIRIERLEKNK